MDSEIYHNEDEQPEEGAPEVLLSVWYQAGTLWLNIMRARNLNLTSGKVYAKSYLLPDSGNSKQKTEYLDDIKSPRFNAVITVSNSFNLHRIQHNFNAV